MDGPHSGVSSPPSEIDDIFLSFRSAIRYVADELLVSSTPGGEWQHF